MDRREALRALGLKEKPWERQLILTPALIRCLDFNRLVPGPEYAQKTIVRIRPVTHDVQHFRRLRESVWIYPTMIVTGVPEE